jgi:hypothetical protein
MASGDLELRMRVGDLIPVSGGMQVSMELVPSREAVAGSAQLNVTVLADRAGDLDGYLRGDEVTVTVSNPQRRGRSQAERVERKNAAA